MNLTSENVANRSESRSRYRQRRRKRNRRSFSSEDKVVESKRRRKQREDDHDRRDKDRHSRRDEEDRDRGRAEHFRERSQYDRYYERDGRDRQSEEYEQHRKTDKRQKEWNPREKGSTQIQRQYDDYGATHRYNSRSPKQRHRDRHEPGHQDIIPTEEESQSRIPPSVPEDAVKSEKETDFVHSISPTDDEEEDSDQGEEDDDDDEESASQSEEQASGSASVQSDHDDEEDNDDEEDGDEEDDDEEEDDEEEDVSGEDTSEEQAEVEPNTIDVRAAVRSRFDDSPAASGEEEEDEEEEEEEDEERDSEAATPTSQMPSSPEGGAYLPSSPSLSPAELREELPKYLPALQGCRSLQEFRCLNRIEEGTYGIVYRARDKKTEEILALKKLKMDREKEGFPITSLREINTILKAPHPNIVTVREIVVGDTIDEIYIVMNYVEHDLKALMESMKQPFLTGEVKTLMIQLLRGVRHLHDNWILHRDLKTSNLLLSHKGELKIGDFGLAREYGSPLKPYTPIVVTLWYRAPELLLGAKRYATAVDMWSVGCIFGELLTQKPLFPGRSEIDQLNKIFKDLGTPSEKIWPGYDQLPAVKKMTFAHHPYNCLQKRLGSLLTSQGFDLMNKLLTYCPERRVSADQALQHPYFRESPLPVEPSMFPTWPAKSEQPRRRSQSSPKAPQGGRDYGQLQGDNDDDISRGGGFHLNSANQGASKAGPGFSLKF